MRPSVLFAVAFTTLSGVVNAQYWKALGRGTVGPTEIQSLYGDSVSDRLLAGGTFMWIRNEQDTVLGMGQAAWYGTRWDSLATRVQPIAGNGAEQTFWYLRFQGDLYACGGFYFLTPDSVWNNYLARLNETTQHWEALGCVNDHTSGILTLVPKWPDTILFATGYTSNSTSMPCELPQACVFRYDGSAFHEWEPFGQIPFDVDNYVGYVFNFQGMTYMTGSLRDPLGPGIVTFLRFNGTTWEHVPGWNTQSPIKEVLIHNDTLYVGGAFRFATGGPGNLIASFDGENWDAMGGGLSYPPVTMSAAALDLEWWHGNLLVSGFFSQADDLPCSSIAKWDGHRWCTFPGDIRWQFNSQPTIYDMAIWRDSLYICGGINTIDGDTIRQVAQWIGGDAVDACSTTGIHESTAVHPVLQVTPLATPGQWSVMLPSTGAWKLEAYNTAGQMEAWWSTSNTSFTINLAQAPPGLYFLRATSATGLQLTTKLIRP